MTATLPLNDLRQGRAGTALTGKTEPAPALRFQAELLEPVTDGGAAHSQGRGDRTDRGTRKDQRFEALPCDDPKRRVLVPMDGGQTIPSDPVGDGRWVPAHPLADPLERQSLREQLLQQSAIHAPRIVASQSD